VTDVSLPILDLSIPVYYILNTAEASSNLARYDGVRFGHRETKGVDGVDAMYEKTRHDGFGPEVRRRILLGTFVLSAGFQDAYYKKALALRQAMRGAFQQVLTTTDMLIGPTTPGVSFPFGAKADPISMYLCDIFVASANITGLPSMSIPAPVAPDAWPVGLQLIGPMFSDRFLMRAGAALMAAGRA
jgi:aspartyl-tRNA(Asn)/glutamyl-tRNA(Gln) amidotransferase subunit A